MKSIRGKEIKTTVSGKKDQREYEKKLLKRMKDKPKIFYSYVRSKQKVKPVVPHLRKEDGETTTNDQEIADVLGKFFESVFTMEEGGGNILLEFENRVPENKVLNEITFTELDIFIKFQQLKEDKACGPDGIHPKILKDCAQD